MQNFKIFSGNAHREFSEKVAKSLDVELSNAEITRFSDGEINIRLCESVRGKEVFEFVLFASKSIYLPLYNPL